jgi:hypothetical protein
MQGQLFTHDFLTRGILDTDPWRTCDDAALDVFIAALRRVYGSLAADSTLNEGQTEDELIGPILDLLGWGGSWLSQVNLSESGRDDVLDFLLFPNAGAKARALKERSDDRRTHHGIALLEAKRWMRPLDRTGASVAGTTKRRDFGAPSSQMLRYLSRAEVMSDHAIKWGLLTNGAMWRLYWQDARSRAEEFFELDVASLLEIPGTQLGLDEIDSRRGLKLFRLLFHREAFLPQSWDGERRSYHAIALTETRRYEETVSHKLGERVFAEVFPDLANALAASDLHANKDGDGRYTRAYLDELREAALVLLEDRALLPVRDARYQDYSLTALRDQIADKRDNGRGFSGTASNYWSRLDNLFSIIADGDDAVGMPAYNGGLFEHSRAPILGRVRVAERSSRRSSTPSPAAPRTSASRASTTATSPFRIWAESTRACSNSLSSNIRPARPSSLDPRVSRAR